MNNDRLKQGINEAAVLTETLYKARINEEIFFFGWAVLITGLCAYFGTGGDVCICLSIFFCAYFILDRLHVIAIETVRHGVLNAIHLSELAPNKNKDSLLD